MAQSEVQARLDLASRDNATQPVVWLTCLQCRLAVDSVQNFEEKMSKLAKDRLPSDEKQPREGIFTIEAKALCQRAPTGSQARWRANSSSADRWSKANDEAGTTQVSWFTLLQRAALPDGGRQSLTACVDFASRMHVCRPHRDCAMQLRPTKVKRIRLTKHEIQKFKENNTDKVYNASHSRAKPEL